MRREQNASYFHAIVCTACTCTASRLQHHARKPQLRFMYPHGAGPHCSAHEVYGDIMRATSISISLGKVSFDTDYRVY